MGNKQLTNNKITPHASRIISNIDTLTSLLIFTAALYAYTATLAPTVIEGDAALFQYTPYVLGVTYPTGFPLYILLGKLWVTLFPVGEIAWRMNLLSALCSATALALIYNATRRLINYQLSMNNLQSPISNLQSPISNLQPPTSNLQPLSRYAALAAVLTFATIPTFWRWSTEAKTYGLNILLFGSLLYTLARALEITHTNHATRNTPHSSLVTHHSSLITHQVRHLWPAIFKSTRYPLALPALLLGLFISVHNTGVLLIPGLLAMAWLYFRRHFRSLKSVVLHLLLLAAPGLFYLYVPLRGEWLVASYGRTGAIERGLLADFYHSGLDGLLRYFTGVGFTEGVVSNWGLVPHQFFTVYLPLLTDDLTRVGIGLGLIGGLGLAAMRPRLFVPLFLWYAVPIPFVLVYGQGEQSAFLLPSFLIFSIFAGYTLIVVTKLTQYATRLTHHSSLITHTCTARRRRCHSLHIIPLLLIIILTPLLFLPQIRHNTVWLTLKWNRDIYNEWSDALNHPLEPNAGMLAHWGDLTPFWYLQHAEGRRPDLRGVYPPTEEVVINWYQRGHSHLYIAGPLQGWASGIQERYHLIPWGRLVRIAPLDTPPNTLLPNMSQPVNSTFGNQLHLIGADYAPQATSGHDFPVTLTWQTLAELPPQATISLRLSQNGIIVAQLDDRLRSGWFPTDTLPAHQPVLTYALLPVPLGTLPGNYRLQLVTYTRANNPWSLPTGQTVLDLGTVEIVPPAADDVSIPAIFKPLPRHNFNGEIELAGYNYSVSRVGQGKGFAVEMLWQARTRPADNYTLLVELLDAAGNVLRTFEHRPVNGLAPTASWQPGQFVLDQVNVVVPASAPPGQEMLQVRLSWQRPDGSKLNVRRWKLLPLDTGLELGWLRVTEKENRTFNAPPLQHPINANLQNKAKLLGYNTSLPPAGGSPPNFRLNVSTCRPADCQIKVDLYWQGIKEMAQLYQVFFHLVDTQGNIVAQHDRVPGKAGKQPTTGWLPGEVVADPITLPLPSNIAAGQYTLRVGMYLPPKGPRLPVVDASGQAVADFVDIGTVQVVAR